jgi:hypothetical protein
MAPAGTSKPHTHGRFKTARSGLGDVGAFGLAISSGRPFWCAAWRLTRGADSSCRGAE